jgi:protein phosphatase PTC2/3
LKNSPLEKAKTGQPLTNTNLLSYGANTHNGIVRLYNEDRISIVLELKKPNQAHATVMYFAIFDGHGGPGCAEFLRDNLHNYIANSPSFPHNLQQSVKEACELAETKFMQQNLHEMKDKSGSCALMCLVTDSQVVVAHVGDSRAIMSSESGADLR